MATTLFISDLHLHPARATVIDAFLKFLESHRGRAQALYILGDLFESWVGDDHPEAAYLPVKLGLKDCVDAGTPVYVLHGNRDFLLGAQFARETGCTLIDDPTHITLDGTPAVLMHGDTLCTDDQEYQQLRTRLRNPEWQRQALSLPVEERLQLAREARELSALANQGKDEYIMDVNQDEVLRVLEQEAVRLIIHGHTHRPAIHDFEHRGVNYRRIVLGDWYQQGSVLYAGDGRQELKTLPI